MIKLEKEYKKPEVLLVLKCLINKEKDKYNMLSN